MDLIRFAIDGVSEGAERNLENHNPLLLAQIEPLGDAYEEFLAPLINAKKKKKNPLTQVTRYIFCVTLTLSPVPFLMSPSFEVESLLTPDWRRQVELTWNNTRWPEIFYKTSCFLKRPFTNQEIVSFRDLFSDYLNFISSKEVRDKYVNSHIDKIVCDLLEYLRSHHLDPSNSLIGACPSAVVFSVMASLSDLPDSVLSCDSPENSFSLPVSLMWSVSPLNTPSIMRQSKTDLRRSKRGKMVAKGGFECKECSQIGTEKLHKCMRCKNFFCETSCETLTQFKYPCLSGQNHTFGKIPQQPQSQQPQPQQPQPRQSQQLQPPLPSQQHESETEDVGHECDRCSSLVNTLQQCQACQQSFCSICCDLTALKNPCSTGLAHQFPPVSWAANSHTSLPSSSPSSSPQASPPSEKLCPSPPPSPPSPPSPSPSCNTSSDRSSSSSVSFSKKRSPARFRAKPRTATSPSTHNSVPFALSSSPSPKSSPSTPPQSSSPQMMTSTTPRNSGWRSSTDLQPKVFKNLNLSPKTPPSQLQSCGRCSFSTLNLKCCTMCLQSFCTNCQKLSRLRNPCSNGLVHKYNTEEVSFDALTDSNDTKTDSEATFFNFDEPSPPLQRRTVTLLHPSQSPTGEKPSQMPPHPNSSDDTPPNNFLRKQPQNRVLNDVVVLQNILLRLSGLVDHPDCVMDEIQDLVKDMTSVYPHREGDLVVVNVSHLSRNREWFTNKSWEQNSPSFASSVFCRLASPIIDDSVSHAEIYLDPLESVRVSVPIPDLWYIKKVKGVYLDSINGARSVLADLQSVLEKELEARVAEYLKSQGVTMEPNSLFDRLTDLVGLQEESKKLSQISESFEDLMKFVMLGLLKTIYSWMGSIPPFLLLGPRKASAISEMKDLIMSCPAMMKKEFRAYHRAAALQYSMLVERYHQIENGTRKRLLCDWWLNHVEDQADKYLADSGYKLDALPTNYTDVPPQSLDLVSQNLAVLNQFMDPKSPALHRFVEKTTNEVYVMLEEIFEEMEFVLSGACEELSQGKKVQELLKRDYEYLVKMREMDEEFRQQRREGIVNSGRLKMTDVVPVAGLIMARLHIHECETTTALDIWSDPTVSLKEKRSRSDTRANFGLIPPPEQFVPDLLGQSGFYSFIDRSASPREPSLIQQNTDDENDDENGINLGQIEENDEIDSEKFFSALELDEKTRQLVSSVMIEGEKLKEKQSGEEEKREKVVEEVEEEGEKTEGKGEKGERKKEKKEKRREKKEKEKKEKKKK